MGYRDGLLVSDCLTVMFRATRNVAACRKGSLGPQGYMLHNTAVVISRWMFTLYFGQKNLSCWLVQPIGHILHP
jgi:hypothetical protein